MTRYHVLNWDRFFENNKSRERDSCSYCCTPNKQHGMGVTFILSLVDGGCVYGVWCLVIGALSQQRRPRLGWLTDDGTALGRPWTAPALARRWRRTETEIARALEVFCSTDVGWMENLSAREVPAECPAPIDLGNGKKGMEGKGIEGKGIEAHAARAFCPEPEVPASGPSLLSFPVVGKGSKTWEFTEGCRADLSSAFPDVDVLAESRKALAWVQGKPNRRKTARGMRSFLTGWMSRTNDRGGGSNGHEESPEQRVQRLFHEPRPV